MADAASRGNGKWDDERQADLTRREASARSVIDKLRELARDFADSGQFSPLERPARQIADVEAEGGRETLDAARQAADGARRLAELRKADDRLAAVQVRLDELQRAFDERAKLDDDRRKLRELAEKQEALAQRAEELAKSAIAASSKSSSRNRTASAPRPTSWRVAHPSFAPKRSPPASTRPKTLPGRPASWRSASAKKHAGQATRQAAPRS